MRRPYKLLIVDDEPITRHGLRQALDWQKLNVQIIGEARDGLEALSMVIDLAPDIVICDVRMPRMDGIALASAVAARRINVQFLFISGYSNREYLKSAIQMGAIDFLDKPFQFTELLSAVERAKRKCDSLQKPEDSEADIALSLIHGEMVPAGSLPFPENCPVFSIVLQLENKVAESFSVFESMSPTQNGDAFERFFERLFAGQYLLSAVKNGYVAHARLPESYTDSDEMITQMEMLCESMELPLSCIGIGSAVPSVSQLHTSYAQAYASAKSAFFYSKKAISYRMLSEKEYAPNVAATAAFFEHLEQADFIRATEDLETLVDDMCTSRYQDIPMIKDELAHISLTLSQKIGPSADTGVAQSIQFAPNIFWIKQYILRQMEKILDQHNYLDDKGRLVFSIEQYVLHHLNADLSINTIASHVFVTPTYLCYIYKKNTGRTIGQYILDMRMKKAARLLRGTGMKIGDVAHAVGCANAGYFAKLFQQHYGETPSEYREHRL